LYYKCPKRGKPDFIAKIFDICATTQTYIFTNSKKFAEILLDILKKKGLKINLIFGDMSFEERDEYINKFRNGEI